MAVLAVGVGVALAAPRLRRGAALPAGALVARLDRLWPSRRWGRRSSPSPSPQSARAGRSARSTGPRFCADAGRSRPRGGAPALAPAGWARADRSPTPTTATVRAGPSGRAASRRSSTGVPLATARNGRYALDVVGSARARLLLRAQEQARAERPRGQPLLSGVPSERRPSARPHAPLSREGAALRIGMRRQRSNLEAETLGSHVIGGGARQECHVARNCCDGLQQSGCLFAAPSSAPPRRKISSRV